MDIRTLAGTVSILATVILIAGGCEETLPKYEQPGYEFRASIAVEQELEAPDHGGAIGPFGVDVFNITGVEDSTQQFVLRPPYRIIAAITISRVDDPSRNITVEKTETFNDVEDHLGPGEFVRVYIDFPPRDSQGHMWNWESIDITEFPLKFAGTVAVEAPDQIPPVDLLLHPPVRLITLIYATP